MKAPFSSYLDSIVPALRVLVERLSEKYEYVSILATDSVGFRVVMSQHSKSVSGQNLTTERGNVIRVYRGGRYSEYAFNEAELTDPEKLAEKICRELDAQQKLLEEIGAENYDTGILPDEPLELFVEKEAEELPENTDMQELVERLSAMSDQGMEMIPGALDCQISAVSTHISKMFLTKNRFLRQSYVYAEGAIASYATREDGETKMVYEGVSGCGGPEILRGLSEVLDRLPQAMKDMLDSEHVIPGEYEIITDPGVTGLIAHEAFGHGVEMDMFVKGRALGSEYIGKRVGSDLVTMHEGALCDESVTAYAFDDEGTLAGDVTEIDHGILKTGICDALSALRLGIAPTGNGKRENYAHKAYTRMTNTVFDSGDSTLEEMIASVSHGYLLKEMESGMEDPKHWGIQCIVSRGYEIRDGKLTGKVVSPVVLTGYVPDLLRSISMVSDTVTIHGSGMCGKGYKEWVRVSDGGPNLKVRVKLG